MRPGPETERMLQESRLSQTCPDCGITEAAGSHCTACVRPMGPADWKAQERGRPVDSERQTEPARVAARKPQGNAINALVAPEAPSAVSVATLGL